MFNLVVDELLKRLEEAHLGCRVRSYFAGAFAYADDIVLLTSSGRQLQLMLDLCVNFRKECDLSFNVKKSLWGFVGVLIGNKYPQFHLDLSDLPRADWFVYLGVKFKFSLKLCADYLLRCGKFLASVSGILRYKVMGYEDVLATILIKKCLHILNYGLDCVVLDSYSFNVVSKSWNNAFRWLFNYRKYDSICWLFYDHNTMSMRYLLDLKLLCFICNTMSCPNMLLRMLSKCLILNGNIGITYRKYGFTLYDNDACIKCAVHKAFFYYCNRIPRN